MTVRSDEQPVRLAERLAATRHFDELFDGGMALIEETAAYLDSEGRESAKALKGAAVALYGTESMKLTTRLMQVASWLLLQRAITEGEMTREQVVAEKKTIRLNRLFATPPGEAWQQLPSGFHDLVARADTLQRRVQRLDDELYGDGQAEKRTRENPVAAQRNLLATAFDARSQN